MKYQIDFSRGAKKQLINIHGPDLKKIVRKIDKLASKPFPIGSEKLKGSDDLYRIRQGDFRIIYSVFEDKLIILVLKIGHRREVYR